MHASWQIRILSIEILFRVSKSSQKSTKGRAGPLNTLQLSFKIEENLQLEAQTTKLRK